MVAIKKNKMIPFSAIWMNLQIVILSEVSQTKTNLILYHLYVEPKKKKNINELTYKTEMSYRYRKQKEFPGERREG